MNLVKVVYSNYENVVSFKDYLGYGFDGELNVVWEGEDLYCGEEDLEVVLNHYHNYEYGAICGDFEEEEDEDY